MTLPELMVALFIGMAVVLATYTIVDSSMSRNRTIGDRRDSVVRGREALELMTRHLRSQVCVATVPAKVPITAGTATSVSFYGYTGNPVQANGNPSTDRDPDSGQPYPSLYTISYAADAITESVAPISSYDPFTVGTATTRTLVDNVTLPSGSLFTFYGPSTGSASAASTTALTLPLTETTETQVVKISIAFKVLPAGRSDTSNKQATLFATDVFWRAIDATNPTEQPCDDAI